MNEPWDIIKYLRRSKSKYIASMFEELEQVLDKGTPEFILARKIILDHFNDFYRAVFKSVLGIEVEGQKYL